MPNIAFNNVAISLQDCPQPDAAHALAKQLQLPLCAQDCDAYPFVLHYTDSRLELRLPQQPKLKPIAVDFTSGKLHHRQQFGGGRGQLIARAVGLKAGVTPRVLDVTAGLGEDAYVLATLGCHVTLVERHPVVAALLRDGLSRVPTEAPSLTLIEADAIELLSKLSTAEAPDVIYMDPMFPHREKSALVKKEMRMLRELVGGDSDASALLTAALAVAKKRVVVKRPRHAPTVSERKPDVVFNGKSCRFDVYLRY